MFTSKEPIDRQDWLEHRAYDIWLSDGQPEGMALKHWLQAEEEVWQNFASEFEDGIAHQLPAGMHAGL